MLVSCHPHTVTTATIINCYHHHHNCNNAIACHPPQWHHQDMPNTRSATLKTCSSANQKQSPPAKACKCARSSLDSTLKQKKVWKETDNEGNAMDNEEMEKEKGKGKEKEKKAMRGKGVRYAAPTTSPHCHCHCHHLCWWDGLFFLGRPY